MSFLTPTPNLVLDFWSHMQIEYGSVVVQKDNAAVMQVAARLLDVLDIQDREQFLTQFTTTLGRTIYVPFTLGVAHDKFSLWSQIVICVHEHQHIEQGDRDGWATFGTRYLTSSSYRAGYEAEAYGCNLEMTWWRHGQMADYAKLAEGLKNYGCTGADIVMARQMLAVRASIVCRGGVETRAAQRAIAWLDAQATT